MIQIIFRSSCLFTIFYLIINRSAAHQQLPVSRTRGHVECARVVEHHAALLLIQIGHLGKSNVVADADANLAVLGVNYRQLIARTQVRALLERDLARYVNVKQVNLLV